MLSQLASFEFSRSARSCAPRLQTRRIVCALLCLLTWRGPLPVLHCHDAEAAVPAAARHHDSYHAHPGTVEIGWHLHVMLWSDFAAEGPGEEPPRPPHACDVVFTPATSWGGATAWRGIANNGWCYSMGAARFCPLAGSAPPCDAASQATFFLTSLLTAQPLCAVLGVSIC